MGRTYADGEGQRNTSITSMAQKISRKQYFLNHEKHNNGEEHEVKSKFLGGSDRLT